MIAVKIKGQVVGHVPGGSIIYEHKHDTGHRWVKLPDGSWKSWMPGGGKPMEIAAGHGLTESWQAAVDSGALVPEGGAMPVTIKDKVMGHVPAGSVIYGYPGSDEDQEGIRWVRLPDGDWKAWSSTRDTEGSSAKAGSNQAETWEAALKHGTFGEVKPRLVRKADPPPRLPVPACVTEWARATGEGDCDAPECEGTAEWEVTVKVSPGWKRRACDEHLTTVMDVLTDTWLDEVGSGRTIRCIGCKGGVSLQGSYWVSADGRRNCDVRWERGRGRHNPEVKLMVVAL